MLSWCAWVWKAHWDLLFPIFLQFYCFVIKRLLLGVFYTLGAFLSTVTALVCFLASIFIGVKVLASALEVYHGAKSAGVVANALRETGKRTGQTTRERNDALTPMTLQLVV